MTDPAPSPDGTQAVPALTLPVDLVVPLDDLARFVAKDDIIATAQHSLDATGRHADLAFGALVSTAIVLAANGQGFSALLSLEAALSVLQGEVQAQIKEHTA